MSLRNYIQDGELQGSQPVEIQGVDTTSPLQALKPGYVRSALNCFPGLSGGLVKRDGYIGVLSTPYGSRDITQGFEYDDAGTKKLIVFGTDRSASGGRFGWNNGGAITDILTGLSGTDRPSFIQIGTQLLFMNGADAPKLWDGTSTKQYGITKPSAAPTAVLAGGGSLNTNSNYIWSYTYYNSTTKAESTPSTLSATTATGANTQATLTLVAGDSATADKIRVYRTVANGKTLYLEDTIAVASTSYVSTNADSTLVDAAQIEFDNTRLETWNAAPKNPVVNDQRVFVQTGNNEARYSKHGQSGPMYESFEARAFIDTSDDLGDSNHLIGHGKAGNITIALKEQSVGMYRRVGFPDASLSYESVVHLYEEIARGVQPLGQHAWVEVFGECIFLAKDNIYGTRGQPGDLRPLANPIQATLRSLGLTDTQRAKISAVNDVKRRLIYFQVFESSTDTTPKRIIVGDYKSYPEFKWTFYEPGTNESTHPGIVAASWFPVTNSTDGSSDFYFGNISLDGQIYHHTGDDDDGSGIYMEVITRPYAGQNPFTQKLWKKGFFFAKGNGDNYSMALASIFDLSGEEELAATSSLFAGGATYDSADVYDTAVYASNAVPRRTYDIHRKGALWQLVFRQTSADAPTTLFSWGVAGSFFFI